MKWLKKVNVKSIKYLLVFKILVITPLNLSKLQLKIFALLLILLL